MTVKAFSAIVFLALFQANNCFAQEKVASQLDALFTSYLERGFAGSVLVAEKNKITLKKAYGQSNNETKALNTPKTLFNVASIGKHFTVYSVLLLEKRGLLKTTDSLSKYTGKFDDARDGVTLHHLLCHTSGLFRQDATLDYSTRAKFIQSVKDGGAESQPDARHRYSNAGYSMLAAVVEIASGQPFETFLLKNVFEPLKMRNTGYPWEKRMNKSLFATGYNSKREPVAVQEDFWAARGPGNLVTSVDDLYTWMTAFQNEKLVDATIKDKILYDHLPGHDTYSWNKAKTERGTRFLHKGGGRADFENRLMWYPDDQVLIIFLINNDYNLARELFDKVRVVMD